MKPFVAAIVTSDWHLSLRPPVWRSNESNWKQTMGVALGQIQKLQKKYRCPILFAGDLTQTCDSNIEFLVWLIENLPHPMHGIPGQHDLAYHNLGDIHLTVFGLLSKMGWIHHMSPGSLKNYTTLGPNSSAWIRSDAPTLAIHPFAYGQELTPYKGPHTKDLLHVALVHKYVWIAGASYIKAPSTSRIDIMPGSKLKTRSHMIGPYYYGYDAIVFGDNHIGFRMKKGKTTIFNCGALMRRNADQLKYKPRVGLLLTDGSIVPYYLDCSKDKHMDAESSKMLKALEVTQTALDESVDRTELKQAIQCLDHKRLADFSERVLQWCRSKGVDRETMKILHMIFADTAAGRKV